MVNPRSSLPYQGLQLAMLALCPAPAISQTDPALRSPWDVRGPKVTDLAFTCKVPPPLPVDIVLADYYSDRKHSEIDPVRYAAYNEAEKPFRETMRITESAADSFQSTGSRQASECVLHILESAAESGAMTGTMSSNQAYYVQNWTLGALAIAWLKVRSAAPGTEKDRQLVTGWLKKVADRTRGYFDRQRTKGSSDSRNNHYAWAGLAVMSAGIASNNRTLFAWGTSAYDDEVSQIQADGTLPLELGRGKRALHYHLFTVAPLVSIAEFGAANGVDLYSRNNDALARLINRAISGLQDSKFFAEKTGDAQDTPLGGKIKSEDVIWLVPYLRRYPNSDFSKLLASISLKPYNYLGGFPPP